MKEHKMLKMLAKKRDLSPHEKKAKMDVVNHMKQDASEMMGDKMDGLKKVSVMSDSDSGLKQGLDKAKQVVSNPEMLAMKNHAENPYGDYKSALEEHMDDEDNSEEMPHLSEGGMPEMDAVGDPQKRQDIADSFKRALGHSEGGEIEESPDEGDYEAVDQESPAEHEDDESSGDESDEHEMSEDEIDAQLERLMAMKKSMGRKS